MSARAATRFIVAAIALIVLVSVAFVALCVVSAIDPSVAAGAAVSSGLAVVWVAAFLVWFAWS